MAEVARLQPARSQPAARDIHLRATLSVGPRSAVSGQERQRRERYEALKLAPRGARHGGHATIVQMWEVGSLTETRRRRRRRRRGRECLGRRKRRRGGGQRGSDASRIRNTGGVVELAWRHLVSWLLNGYSPTKAHIGNTDCRASALRQALSVWGTPPHHTSTPQHE